MLYVNARLLKQYGRKVAEGTVLCKEGQPGDHMFIIYAGKVRISKNIDGEEKTLVVLGDGEFFGEMAIILKEPRTATATCSVDSEILIIDAQGFDTMVRKSPDMSLRMIKSIADRLKASNEMIAILSHMNVNDRIISYIELLSRMSETRVEDGIQILLNQNEMISKLSVDEKDVVDTMQQLKRANLCYKIRQNFYCVTEVDKLHKFMMFLQMQRKKKGE